MFSHVAQRGWQAGAACAALALSISLTACGGSSNPGSAALDSGSADSAGIANATAFIKPYLAPPTGISVSTPLTAQPPKGKTFVWMQCDAPQCALITDFMKEATAAVGWNLKTINFQTADPATLVSGLEQALQLNPAAVSLVGLPYAVWQSVIPDYEKAGVPIIPMFTSDVPLSKTVPTNIAGPDMDRTWGKIIGNWFVSDSKGQGRAELVTSPELAPTNYFHEGFLDAVHANCPACQITELSLSYADVAAGKAPASIVSALQQHPDVNYLISAEQANDTGVPEALKAAGLTNLKLAGSSAEKSEEAAVESGELAAITPTATNFGAWLAVDAALRYSLGMPQLQNVPINTMLITKDSGFTPSVSFDEPTDWKEQFKSLWKVG